MLTVLLGIFNLMPIRQIYADGDPNDVGTCVISYTGNVSCATWKGNYDQSAGTCTVSNWTRQSCNQNVSLGNTQGNLFTTVYPVTQLGWCTLNSTTTGGYAFKNCVLDNNGQWYATAPATNTNSTNTSGSTGLSTPSSTGLSTPSNPCPAGTICNPIPSITSLPNLIQTILTGVLKIGLPIVALALVYCGFLFVKARGNPEELNKAKEALLWTIVGAAILLGSWALAQMINATVLAL